MDKQQVNADGIEKQEQFGKCQICQESLKMQDTYAGVFQRVCQKCYAGAIQDLDKPICKIKQGIFIGNQLGARSEGLLLELKIGAICVCGSDLKIHNYDTLKIQRTIVPVKDTLTENIGKKMPQAIKWIQNMRKKNLNVLIHCAGGISRSASVCIGYFMQIQKMSFRQAYLFVKKSRKCIKPNQTFVKQLKQYEKYLSR